MRTKHTTSRKGRLTTTGRGYEWEGTNIGRQSWFDSGWVEKTKAMVNRGFRRFCAKRNIPEYYDGHNWNFSDNPRP